MFSQITLRISIHRRFAAVTAASLIALTSGSAMAAVVCGPTANYSIPANVDGVYINFVTGATGTAGSAVTGWDWNAYLTGGALYFFWPATPANSHGGASTGGIYDVLTSGASVGPTSTFIVSSGSGGAGPFVNWQATNTGRYLGVRFFNEATSAINYGWVQLNTTGATGFPATIVQYCYQNDGTAITAGTTPVSLQKFSVD